jgi:hypothetical protein
MDLMTLYDFTGTIMNRMVVSPYGLGGPPDGLDAVDFHPLMAQRRQQYLDRIG